MTERAHARSTDPGTSHEAAASVDKIRASQVAIWNILRQYGPMTDTKLIERYRLEETRLAVPKQTDSSIRTRRSELVNEKFVVRDSGRKEVLESGRRSIIWEVCDRPAHAPAEPAFEQASLLDAPPAETPAAPSSYDPYSEFS